MMDSLESIRIFRCSACGTGSLISREYCPNCHGGDVQAVSEPAVAKVVSWTIIRRPPAAYAPDGPYLLLVAELASGMRITGRLADEDALLGGIRIGDPVDYRGCEQGIHMFKRREV